MRFPPDPGAADWLLRSDIPPFPLITFGPAGFEAYARLRFIPDPTGPGQHEADVDVPDDHPPDITTARRALDRLAAFTSTPDDWFFLAWEGYSDVVLLPDAPIVDLPHRRCRLFQGSPRDLGDWALPPAMVWPADRRWCFAGDVDPHWAGIGATRAAIDALIADPELDVVPARPAEEQPHYY